MSTASTPQPARRRRVRWIRIAAGVIIVAVLLYAASAPLLTYLGGQLVHADPPERVDAMIVLASGIDRIIEASELYKAGYAPLVVLTRDPPEPTNEFLRSHGIPVDSGEQRRQTILHALGVPPQAIVVLDEVIYSTADEARIFARWAASRPIRSVMIVTSPPHTARSRLTFIHALRGRMVKVIVRPSTLTRFRADNWWKSRDTLRDGFYEWQKLVYYRLFELTGSPG
jgi:uncharacterized SAM-binding protein YcdF (DUF218 family)